MVEGVPCAICGCSQTVPLFAAQPLDANQWLRCAGCGLCFVHPIPLWDDRRPHYADTYPGYQRMENATSTLARRSIAFGLGRRADLIGRFQRAGLLLDVGCGGGDLMAILARRGWSPLGVEAVVPMAAVAARRSGCPVVAGDSALLPIASECCDAVLLWTTLEHCADPRTALAEAARVLRPGGALILNTTSTRSLASHLFGHHWMGYDAPRVLYVFSPPSLRHLLADCGLHFEWIGGQTNDYHPLLWSLTNLCAERLRTHLPGARLCCALLSVAGSLPVRLLTYPFLRLLTAAGRSSFLAAVARKET